MVIRRRLFVMMAAMAVSSLLVLFLFWFLLEKNISSILEHRNDETHDSIARIIQLEGKRMEGFAFDYSFRTEMATFVRSVDQVWAERNLDTALDLFECEACWVFDDDYDFVDCRTAAPGVGASNLLDSAICRQAFASAKFPHWFMQVGSEMFEFRGGPIQPSNDVKRESQPRGYLIVVRHWGEKRMAAMRDLLDADNLRFTLGVFESLESPHDAKGCSFHEYEMPVLKGASGISLVAEVCSPRVDRLVQMNTFASVAVSMMLILTVALFIIGLVVWVSVPVNRMSEALATKNPKLVEGLLSQKNELGRLAHLIKRFFIQSNELEKEVAHRKEMQAKQSKLNSILRIWGRCNFAMTTAGSEEEMLKRVCGIIVETGKYKACWIGDVQWKGSRASVQPLARAGYDGGFLDSMRKDLIGNAFSLKCIVGKTLRTKDVAACRGMDGDSRDCEQWEVHAHECGIRSAACFPMLSQGEIFAVLVIFSAEPADLDSEERHVFAEVVENLGAGILLVRSEHARLGAEKKADELAEQLMLTQKLEAVGRMAGGIAHDFNKLLLSIMGDIELCMKDSSGKSKDRLAEALATCKQASGLTDKLMALERKKVYAAEPVNINEEIEKALDFAKSALGENVELKFSLDGNVGLLLGDPVQIRQIITNVALNACEAMPNGGTLTVSTESVCVESDFAPDAVPGDYVLMSMTDTGDGMDSEVLEHALEPFFTTKERGTGLGLAMVNSIVVQHSGFMRVSSVKGGGSTFRIFLPIADVLPGGESEIASADVLRARNGEKILLVEDRDMCRLLTKTMLESLGYVVIDANGPAQAIEKATSLGDDIDVILTDVVMPGMNGPEMLVKLREQGIKTKVVYMSGYADGALAERSLAGTRVGLLQKPFMLSQLAQIIREALIKG